MITFAEAVSTPAVASASRSVRRAVPAEEQREVERLVASLLATPDGAHARCFVLLDTGETDRSSMWLASATASLLSERMERAVHVLSTEAEVRAKRGFASATRSGEGNSPAPEFVGQSSAEGRSGNSLGERIKDMRAANQPVVVHLAQPQDVGQLLSCGRAVDAAVLLVRASRTRRAALQAIVQQLSHAGLPLLGCVLLDRLHPIPEKVYRLL